MSDRFDFEQEILSCWNIVDDIRLLNEKIMDSDVLDKDDIANYLLGLQTIYELKFDKCFKTFETLIRDGNIK
jgi:hypothetical protein